MPSRRNRPFLSRPSPPPRTAALPARRSSPGTYPQTNGVLGLTHDPFGWDLKEPTAHIAQRLKSAGYQTELVGVHHESRVLADDVVAARLGFDRVRTGGARDVVVGPRN